MVFVCSHYFSFASLIVVCHRGEFWIPIQPKGGGGSTQKGRSYEFKRRVAHKKGVHKASDGSVLRLEGSSAKQSTTSG